MFLLKWINWIRNKFTSARQEDPPPSDTVTVTMETPDMAMRKVRQLLEEVDLVPTAIDVTLHNNSICIYMGGSIYPGEKVKVKYVDQGDYCAVELDTYTKNSGERTSKYHQNFLEVFLNDFSAILQICKPHLRDLKILINGSHFHRSTKKPFWLLGCFRSRSKQGNYSRDPDTTMLQLFKNYQKLMNFFDDHPMTIKKLEITVVENSQISKILSIIKTEELIVYGTFGGADSLNFGEIVKLENWRSIKNLSILFIAVVHPITLFLDKPAVFIGIDSISSDEIRLIVKTFRNNPSMRRWYFWLRKKTVDVKDLLVREFGQPSQEDRWFFNIPGSEKVVNVSIWSEETIYFDKLDRDKIPKDVKIY